MDYDVNAGGGGLAGSESDVVDPNPVIPPAVPAPYDEASPMAKEDPRDPAAEAAAITAHAERVKDSQLKGKLRAARDMMDAQEVPE